MLWQSRIVEDRRTDAKGPCACQQPRRSSVFCEMLEQLNAVCVDLFGRWCWAVFGEKAPSGFVRPGGRLFLYGSCELALKNVLHIVSGGKTVSVGLGFEGGLKVAGQLNSQRHERFPLAWRSIRDS